VASPYLSCFVAIGAAVLAGVAWLLLPTSTIAAVVVENGLVEWATVAVYGMAIVVLCWNRRAVSDRRAWAALLVVVLAFAAREMDLHVAWTGISTLKVRFYLGDAPLHQKIIGFLAAAATGVALLYLVVRQGMPTLRRLRQQNPYAITTVVFFGTLVVSKMLDRSFSVLTEDYGVAISESVRVLVQATEEMLELALPALIALGVLQGRRRETFR
jgi:hypothetical protein